MNLAPIPWKSKLEDLLPPVDSTDELAVPILLLRLGLLLFVVVIALSMFLPNVFLAMALFLRLVWFPFDPLVLAGFVVASVLSCCLGRVIQGFFRIAKGRMEWNYYLERN